MPASTLPVSIWASTDFTSGCSVTGVTWIPAFLNTSAATVPHGTCGWHNATFTDDLASLSTDVTCAGLDGGTAISKMFLAKFDGLDASPAVTTCCMFAGAAEANTSAGAPLMIWVARPELGPKLNVTLSPGWRVSNCCASWLKAPVSDDAANTVIDPDEDAELLPPAEPPGLLLEQPASAQAASPAAIKVRRRTMHSLRSDLASRRSADRRDLDGHVGRLNGRDREHSGLETEFVGGFPAQQRHEPVRPRLDLDLSHHGVAHDAADQAAEPVAYRMGDHGPALPVIPRFGKLLHEAGERYPVNGQPPRGVGDRPYPARVGPAAEGVATDPDEVGGFLDPVRRHYLTLTQIRL